MIIICDSINYEHFNKVGVGFQLIIKWVHIHFLTRAN